MWNIIPLLFLLENQKKCPSFRKKVLIVSILGLNFFQKGLSFVCFWRNVYWSVLVPKNLLCLEKFLVARLHKEITPKSMSQTKEKCDPLVLRRSYLWMVWSRCHEFLRAHRYYFCLEPKAREDTWLRTTSVTVMVILFESSILKVTWSQLCSEFLLKNY